MSDFTSMRPEFRGVLASQLSRKLEDESEAAGKDVREVSLFGYGQDPFDPFSHHVVPMKFAALRRFQQVEEELARARTLEHHHRQTLEGRVAELSKWKITVNPTTVDMLLAAHAGHFFVSDAKAFKAEPHPVVGIAEIRRSLTRHITIKAVKVEEARSSGFEPSLLLTGHLVDGIGALPAETQREVASRLRDLVMGMFQSIADAHVYAGKTEPYRISVGQKFVRQVTRAVQFRLDIDPYEEGPFLYQLYRELEAACPLKMDDWSLELAADGSLSLSVAHKTSPKPTREKAQVVRMRFGKRGTLPNE